MKKTEMLLKGIAAIVGIIPTLAVAGPSNEWSEAWGFRTTTTMNTRLIQADLIEKQNEGYYERLGTSINYVTNNINYYIDDRKGNFGDITATEGGEVSFAMDNSDTATTAIGAYNNNSSTVNIHGDRNTVDISNIANSKGDQDGSISYEAGDDISIIGATSVEGAR